jgi:uncharacterized protein YjbI with pentapeptide repeats
MSEQNGTQTSTKPRRSRQASKQNGTQEITLQPPTSDDKEEWEKFWKSKNQSWRTEPEISAERQKYLADRRLIKLDYKKVLYPFTDIQLSRADVEWLLATHDNNMGPINWNDESQRQRVGLDLRGADLSHDDLSYLPLAKCDLSTAQLQRTIFNQAQLQDANLNKAQLQGANLIEAQLQDAYLAEAQLQDANLIDAQLQGSFLTEAQLKGTNLLGAKLQGATLTGAVLQGANLSYAQLQGADLINVYLQGAYLIEAQLQRVKLHEATLADEDHIGPYLVDVNWGDTNLAVVDWSQISKLNDDNSDYKMSARAYHQLSVVLHNQGLNEDAARFAYRAQLMQRVVFRQQRKYGQYLFSLFLDLLSGYGYKVGRCFIAYALVIGVFATIYHLLGTHPAWNESIVISMTAFHGRGFFPEQFHPGDPQALAAAIEAFVGLLIEITLIATLTQRLFGK